MKMFPPVVVVLLFVWLCTTSCDDPVSDPRRIMPQNVTISINENAEATKDTTLIVSISGANISEMIISTDPEFSDVDWEGYVEFKVFHVPKLERFTSVFGKFAAAGGGTTGVISDAIRMDFTAEILSSTMSSESDTLFAGDEIEFALHTNESGKAKVRFTDIGLEFSLAEVDVGVFEGTLEIPHGINDQNAKAIGYFEDSVGNVAIPDTVEGAVAVVGVNLAPRIVAELSLAGTFGFDVIYHERHCFISDTQAVHVISVSEPDQPGLVRTIETGDWNSKMFADDERLYVPHRYGVAILTIDPPDNARLLETVPITGKPRDLVRAGEYSFVACLNEGLKVLDLRVTDDPLYIGGKRIPGYGERILLRDNIAYIVGAESFEIITVDDPYNPDSLAYSEFRGEPEEAVLYNDCLIISTTWQGVWIYDVSHSDCPELVAHHEQITNSKALEVLSPFLFVGGANGFIRIINITDLVNFHEIGRLDNIGPVTAMDIEGNYMYAVHEDKFYVISLFEVET